MRRKMIRSIDPFTGEVIGTLPAAGAAEVRAAVARARLAQPAWARENVSSQVRRVLTVAERLARAGDELALLITRETGKPIREARGELAAAQRRIRHIAGRARRAARLVTRVSDGKTHGVFRPEPLGVAAVITAWNYPISVPCQVIVSALLAGNTVVFKPSELTPLCGARLGELFGELLPANCLIPLTGAEETGRALVASDVDMVAFVGSGAAGRAIMAASAAKLHRLALELGGKDPAIVCHDADLDWVARRMMTAALGNCGQECNSVERVYVDRRVEKELLRRLVAEVKRLRAGDPRREETDIGPMISERQRSLVESHVNDALRRGARALTGGRRPRRRGFFYPPTVLTGVDHTMRVMREETFGPVIPVMAFDTEEEAIHLANDSEFGLGASVWSKDILRARSIAQRLIAGIRGINGPGSANAHFPWGGAKQSGLGRMMGPDPFEDFSEVRSVMIHG